MKYYIKASERATIKAFNTDNWQPVEAIENYNNSILAALYNKLITGTIKYFYQRTKRNLIIAHKSTRPNTIIQISHAAIIGGDIIPLRHDNINCFQDLLKASPFYEGNYIMEGRT